MSSGSSSKEVGFQLYTITSGTVLMLCYFVNLRLFGQATHLFGDANLFENGIKNVVQVLIYHLGMGKYSFMFVFILFSLIIYAIGQYFRRYDDDDKTKGMAHYYRILIFSLGGFLFAIVVSPEILLALDVSRMIHATTFLLFTGLYGASIVGYFYSASVVFRTKDKQKGVDADKFGRNIRAFPQTTEKMENEYSVNIQYEFLKEDGTYREGYINVINQHRGNQVIGVPGSGKSYAFFLPMIEQNLKKGQSMVLYDFKYPDLSEHAITCLNIYKEEIVKKRGASPKVSSVYFDNEFFSSRINVLQPHMLKDFTLDAVNVAKVFMMALNPSWATKEGDFFVESAVNICASTIWALKIYKNGIYCTLPHVIEMLALKTEDLVNIFIALEDDSLRNIVAPFKTAMEMGAGEQLAGQMGSVQIPLSRLSSPIVYWNLTTENSESNITLDVNQKESYQVLCLGNSSERATVNNIFFSLFIAQIFRMVNYKGRLPLSVVLDEVVTLTFPKGTLDKLIATGRSNLIAVWMGYQDLSQLYRDMTKDVGDSLFKMVGNTFAGSVKDETGDKLEKRLGKVRIIKKNKSLSSNEEASFSFNENEDYAVPASFFSTMSQGEFAGEVADNYGEEISHKVFHGKVKYKTPYKKPMKMPLNSYWADILDREKIKYDHFKAVVDTELEQDEEYKKAKAISQKILKENYMGIVNDIQKMKLDLTGVPEPKT